MIAREKEMGQTNENQSEGRVEPFSDKIDTVDVLDKTTMQTTDATSTLDHGDTIERDGVVDKQDLMPPNVDVDDEEAQEKDTETRIEDSSSVTFRDGDAKRKKKLRFLFRFLRGFAEVLLLTGLCACFNILWWLLSGCTSRWCFLAFHVGTLFALQLMMLLVVALYRKALKKFGQRRTVSSANTEGSNDDDSSPQDQEQNIQEQSLSTRNQQEPQQVEESTFPGRKLITYMNQLRPDTYLWVVVVFMTLIGCQIILIFWLPTSVIVSDMEGNLGRASKSLWHPDSTNLSIRNLPHNDSDFGIPYWSNRWEDKDDPYWYKDCNFTHLMLFAQYKYGDCIDFTKIKVVYGGMTRYFDRSSAQCIGDTVFFNYCPGRNLLLHELAHAWQFQHDIYFYGRKGPGNFIEWLRGQLSDDTDAFYDPFPAMNDAYFSRDASPPPYQDVFNAEQMAEVIAYGMTWGETEISEAHQYYFEQMLGQCLHDD